MPGAPDTPNRGTVVLSSAGPASYVVDQDVFTQVLRIGMEGAAPVETRDVLHEGSQGR